MQNPQLSNTVVTCPVPGSDMTAALFIHTNGSIQTRFDGSGSTLCALTSYPPQWGGIAPTALMGNLYEVRATHISGNNPLADGEFDAQGVWLPLSVGRSFVSLTAGGGGSPIVFSAVTLLEIRRAANQQVLASAQWTLTWTDNGL